MPAYNTPGVYIEEISGGPRPIQASSTTDTGFVGVLTLPSSFLAGKGKAASMFLPASDDSPLLSWNRALAFRRLLPGPVGEDSPDKAAKGKKASGRPAGENRFMDLLDEVLPGKWNVSSPKDDDSFVTLSSEEGSFVRFPARRTIFSVKTRKEGEKDLAEWDLSFAADDQQVLELIATHAGPSNVGHNGILGAVDTAKAITIDVAGIHDRMMKSASMLTSADAFESWRRDLGQELFTEILQEGKPGTTASQAAAVWETLPASARKSWDEWLRGHPGLRRLELGIRGFFENGGQTAFIALAIQEGVKGVDKRKFLEASFDGISAVAMLAAPGLEFAWQQAILEYAGPAGRGDLFAVLEAPRYFLTKEPRSVKLSPYRWVESDSPYEVATLQTLGSPQSTELRFSGYAKDELLDRAIPRDTSGYGAAYAPWLIVDNPLSTGPHDRYVIAPPSGHVAGVIAATDLKPGGGVHKAPANEQVLGCADLVTEVADKEQGILNIKGVNIIRHRPFAGIRIWGARTIASDPLWNYINVRRLFLMVERSIRDAIQWAVFLPNTPATRADLKSTIAAFLYRLWKEGALDGESWSEAFSVQCDSQNNPDVDVRSGLLTVDVQMRPVFPAEFIRVRFRQSPMRTEVG